MKNLLPPLKTDYVLEKTRQKVEWTPSVADPSNGKIPSALAYLKKDVVIDVITDTVTNKISFAEPNQRMISQDILLAMDVSPLSIAERGIEELPLIIFDQGNNEIFDKSINKTLRGGSTNSYHLILNLINDLPIDMDLYFQKVNSITSAVVLSHSNCRRFTTYLLIKYIILT